MKPFYNPFFLCRALKSYCSDIDRLREINEYTLKKYQDKSLQRIIKYAFQVPMYKEKYARANIKPDDIKSVEDIKKLPILTKEDLRKYSPDGVTPPFFNKKSAFMGRTGGTTGKPTVVFLDYYTVLRSMLSLIRMMREYDISWRKTRMTLLLDLTDNSFENAYFVDSVSPSIKPFFSLNNMQVLNQLDSAATLVKKIESFQPVVLAGYPSVVNEIALLKRKGFADKLKPEKILTSGQFLDKNVRRFIEDVFQTRVYDSYITTETGPIGFECENKVYHVNSDFIYTEYLKNGEQIGPGKSGEIVITKLQGYGTPLIRYNGLGDIVTPTDDCSCNFAGSRIKSIHGRKYNSIYLPDGRIVLPSFIENIFSEILLKTKVNNQKRTQIIQHKMDNVEIRIQFDKELNNAGCSTGELFDFMRKKMQKAFGPDVEIVFKEVDSFEENAPYLVSKINKDKFIEKNYVVSPLP